MDRPADRPAIEDRKQIYANFRFRNNPQHTPNVNGVKPRAKAPCRFYLTTFGCKSGSDCRFSHTPQSAGIGAAWDPTRRARQEVSPATDNGKPKVVGPRASLRPCKFFDTHGGCRNGTNCQFAHVKDEIAQAKQAAPIATAAATKGPQLGSRGLRADVGEKVGEPEADDREESSRIMEQTLPSLSSVKCGVCQGDFVRLPGSEMDVCDVLREHYEIMFYTKHAAHTRYFDKATYSSLAKGHSLRCAVEGCSECFSSIADLLQHLGYFGKWSDRPREGDLQSDHQFSLSSIAWQFAWRDTEKYIIGTTEEQELDRVLLGLLGQVGSTSLDGKSEKKEERLLSAQEKDWLHGASGERPESLVQFSNLTQKQLQQEVDRSQSDSRKPISYDFLKQRDMSWRKGQMCLLCSEVKMGLDGIKQHFAERHKQEKVQCLKCHLCGLECTLEGFMQYHLRLKHHVVVSEKSIKQVLCVSDFTGKCSVDHWPRFQANPFVIDRRFVPSTQPSVIQTEPVVAATNAESLFHSRSSTFGMLSNSGMKTFSELHSQEPKRKIVEEYEQESFKKLRPEGALCCDVGACGRAFPHEEHLLSHKEAVHGILNPRPCVKCHCSICGKAFDSLVSMCMHSRAKHKGVVNFTYRRGGPATLRSPATNINFKLPRQGWSKEAIEEFEKFLKDPGGLPQEDRGLSWSSLLAKKIAQYAPAEAGKMDKLGAQDDSVIFGDSGCGDMAESHLASVRMKRLKSLLEKSGYQYDIVAKKTVRGKLNCPMLACGRVLKSLIALRNHCRREHAAMMRRASKVKCHVCGHDTHNPELLCCHLSDAHELKIPVKLISRCMGVTDFEVFKNPPQIDEEDSATSGAPCFEGSGEEGPCDDDE